APTALNNPSMLYRLAYVNDLQARSYAGSRWSMPPAQLLEQRLKARLAQAGTVVLSGREGANTLPVLRIDVDELMQNFSSPQQSQAQLALRATLFNGRTLLASKSFRQLAPAASADAAGGARAMADASDALIDELIAWLAALPLQK
ncbi:MAG: ABC-type transport auxiliary lipoprotein family protein, partial [Oxalobacteraceae bacterium]